MATTKTIVTNVNTPTDGYTLVYQASTDRWIPVEPFVGPAGPAGATGPTGPAGANASQVLKMVTVGPSGSSADFVCDGISDEIEFNSAIDQANSTGTGMVSVLPGEYSVSSAILMKSNVRLVGIGKVKITAATNFNYTNNQGIIMALGTVTTGTAILLSSNVADGYHTIQVTSSAEYDAVQPDEYLALISEKIWEPLSDLSGRKVGEFVKVSNKFPNHFTIYGVTSQNYDVADTARLYRVTFVKNISIENIEITQASPIQTIANAGNCVLLQLTENAVVKNCNLHDFDGAGVGIAHCIKTNVFDNQISNLTDRPVDGYYGYGVVQGGCSEQTVMRGNNIDNVRHGYSSGPPRTASIALGGYGNARNTIITENTLAHCTNSALDTHAQSDGISISNNMISSCATWAIFTRGRGTHIMGNAIEFCGCGISVGITPQTSGGSGSGSMVVGNTIRHMKQIVSQTRNGAITGTGQAIQVFQTDNVIVQGNTIEGCDTQGIFLSIYARHCIIKNNTILNANITNSATAGAIGLATPLNASTANLTAFAGNEVTLTYAGTGFTSAYQAGQYIVISGAATPANNGRFQITQIVSTSSIKFLNPSGVAPDANNGSISFVVEGATDNLIINNTAINTPASTYDFGVTGRAKFLVSDASNGGNARNIFKDNIGIRMENTLFQNINSLSFYSGNTSTDTNPIKNVSATPTDSMFAVGDGYRYSGLLAMNTTDNTVYLRTSSANTWNRIDFSTVGQWESNVATVRLNQKDETANSVNGRLLTIRAQNSTGTGTTGGSLVLSPGSGTSSNGTIRLTDPGGSLAVQIAPVPTGATSITMVAGVTAFNMNQTATSTTAGAPWTFNAQNATGDTFAGGNITLQGGSATGLTANGGSVNLQTGAGTANNGSLNFRVGSNTFVTFLNPNPTGAVDMNWVSSITAPRIIHATTSGAGANFTIAAQGSSASTGGALVLQAGAGVGAVGGDVILTTGTGTSNGDLRLVNVNSTGTATGGSATLPTNPQGFLTVYINGTLRKIPYYNT